MDHAYIDLHAHMNDRRFDADMADVLSRMKEHAVAALVVGTDRDMSERALSLAREHPGLILGATVGQHPTDKHKEEFDADWYREAAERKEMVAIGECGLDYYWPTNKDSRKDFGDIDVEKGRQRELFAAQIALAESARKPLMIHGRPSPGSMDAYEDILRMLKGKNVSGDVHFFVGNTDVARRFLDLGFSFSFTGVVTFARDYDETLRYIPLDRIMSETDAPYVAPAPWRGKRNEPAYVREVVREIARIRGEDEEVIRVALLHNAKRFLGIS